MEADLKKICLQNKVQLRICSGLRSGENSTRATCIYDALYIIDVFQSFHASKFIPHYLILFIVYQYTNLYLVLSCHQTWSSILQRRIISAIMCIKQITSLEHYISCIEFSFFLQKELSIFRNPPRLNNLWSVRERWHYKQPSQGFGH